MTTYPLFVPAGDDHVATVLTVPSSEPDGLVVVLAGTGRHNVVGGTMAGLLSARLAQAGLASVRLDYAGVGDSSGEVETWSPSDLEAALTQAQATVRTAREVLGIDRYAAVGTCYGSRVALSLVGDPACAGAVCLAPPILDPGAMRRAGRRLEGGSILGAIRSSPLGRKLVLGPARRLLRSRKASGRVVGALSQLGDAKLAFLYGGRNPDADHLSPRAREILEARAAALPPAQRERFSLQVLDSGPLTTFDGLPGAEQEAILDVVVPLVEACFAGAG